MTYHNLHLHANSFQAPSSDPCIYVKGQGQDILIISVYINNQGNMLHLKHILSNQFHMKDLGPVTPFSG
jgi:hypothetical protein